MRQRTAAFLCVVGLRARASISERPWALLQSSWGTFAAFRNARSGNSSQISGCTAAGAGRGWDSLDGRSVKATTMPTARPDIVSVKPHEVDYYLNDPTHQFSLSQRWCPSWMVPQGNRLMMGAKFRTGTAAPSTGRAVRQAQRRGRQLVTKKLHLTVPTSSTTVSSRRVDAVHPIRPDAGWRTSAAGHYRGARRSNPKHHRQSAPGVSTTRCVVAGARAAGYRVSPWDPGAPHQPEPAVVCG